MKKSFIKLVCIFTILLFSSGCNSKEILTTNAFTAILKNNGFTLIDLTENYKNQDYINKIIIGKSNEDYQIEYYMLKDEETAKEIFNQNVNNILSLRVSATKQSKLEGNNYLKYMLTTTNNYFVVIQVDNTLIYIEAPIANEAQINSILTEMKY